MPYPCKNTVNWTSQVDVRLPRIQLATPGAPCDAVGPISGYRTRIAIDGMDITNAVTDFQVISKLKEPTKVQMTIVVSDVSWGDFPAHDCTCPPDKVDS